MPIQDDRYLAQNLDRTTNPHKFDAVARLHDLELANLVSNTYFWLELAADDIHKATIAPPEPEEPFIDFSKPPSEYEQEYADRLLAQDERKKRTEENLANRADRINRFINDEATIELIKNTPGLAVKIKFLIADFRKNGPLDICQNPAVQKFLTDIEGFLAD